MNGFFQGLVIASLSDLARPVEKLSPAQTASLAATGMVWSRYSLVIIPKNYSLFSVNFFVAVTNLSQLARIYMHRKETASSSSPTTTLAEATIPKTIANSTSN